MRVLRREREKKRESERNLAGARADIYTGGATAVGGQEWQYASEVDEEGAQVLLFEEGTTGVLM